MTTKNNNNKYWAYCRISTKQQSITRQSRNILAEYPNAQVINEVYTGTSSDRPQWNKLLKEVKPNQTIVFDSVSRMSRNAEEGFKTYMELFERGVNLVFLKEPHINTDTYKKAFNIDMNVEVGGNGKTKDIIDLALQFVKNAMELLAQEQIEQAFQQAEKEVMDLRQRTKEGIITAKAEGSVFGRRQGAKIETAKAKDNKAKIIKLSKSFNGTLTDKEVLELLDIDRTTYYRYKKQLKEQQATE